MSSGWTLYIIQSTVSDKLYTGISTDPVSRLRKHNLGKGAKATRAGRPWKLAYLELCASKGAALSREHAMKKLKRAEKLRCISLHAAQG